MPLNFIHIPGDNGHIPVLLQPMLDVLAPREGSVYLDGTFGGGGYSRAILESTPCIVHALDRDPAAIERSAPLKEAYPDRFFFHEGSFSDLPGLFDAHSFDGMVFDFGVSSFQLDTPERGFSFRFDGPLDMRMDPSCKLDAATVVNTFSENDLADILYVYGEEPRARQIARAIVTSRKETPFTTTHQLAECIRRVVFKKSDIDPATLSFQGLRIYVNNELIEIDQAFKATVSLLKDKGKIVTVSFHSLEDRLCKQFFKQQLPWLANEPVLSIESLTRKPISPTTEDIAHNPRCRSGKLRGGIVHRC